MPGARRAMRGPAGQPCVGARGSQKKSNVAPWRPPPASTLAAGSWQLGALGLQSFPCLPGPAGLGLSLALIVAIEKSFTRGRLQRDFHYFHLYLFQFIPPCAMPISRGKYRGCHLIYYLAPSHGMDLQPGRVRLTKSKDTQTLTTKGTKWKTAVLDLISISPPLHSSSFFFFIL